MLRFLQNYPRLLEAVYRATHRVLLPLKPWLKPGGGVEALFVWAEKGTKGAMFDCRMCGQCILHSTGMTCPMACPKELRNGPCGGVRPDGNCEVLPEMLCVWTQAWDRSKQMSVYGMEILHIQPPVNRQLQGTSAWINDFTDIAMTPPPGWVQ